MLLDKPVDTVGGAAFLIGGQGEDQIARRAEIFALHAQEGGDQGRVVAFHVGGAASVEIAAVFAEDEGIGRPVGAAGLDDVEVSEEEDGAAGSGAARRTTRLPLRATGASTWMSAAGYPAARKRAAMASAACVLSPKNRWY